MPDTMTRDQQGEDTSAEPLAKEQKAKDLSWLTEGADGFRDKDLALIVDENKDLKIVNLDEVAGRRIVARVKTPNKQHSRTRVEVICQIEGSSEEQVPLPTGENYDAVFWTESSIEKFLYPYYHAQRLWDDDMDRLKREFEGDASVVAIAHRAPSKSSKVASLQIGLATKKGPIVWKSLEEYFTLRTGKSAGQPTMPI